MSTGKNLSLLYEIFSMQTFKTNPYLERADDDRELQECQKNPFFLT